MKRFRYPLDRILRLRRLQMERIEARLNDLACQAALERRTAHERSEQSIECGVDLISHTNLLGSDIQITRHWLARLDRERGGAIQRSQELLQQHSQVLSDLVEARRKVELLETLRQRKVRAHALAQNKQLEAEATELHLARRARTQKI